MDRGSEGTFKVSELHQVDADSSFIDILKRVPPVVAIILLFFRFRLLPADDNEVRKELGMQMEGQPLLYPGLRKFLPRDYS